MPPERCLPPTAPDPEAKRPSSERAWEARVPGGRQRRPGRGWQGNRGPGGSRAHWLEGQGLLGQGGSGWGRPCEGRRGTQAGH